MKKAKLGIVLILQKDIKQTSMCCTVVIQASWDFTIFRWTPKKGKGNI
jgi:hypothetical protein